MTFGLRTIIQRVKKFFRQEKSADENSETNEVEERYLREPMRVCHQSLCRAMTMGEQKHINMECCLPVAARQAQ
jgi:hypothetical protein